MSFYPLTEAMVYGYCGPRLVNPYHFLSGPSHVPPNILRRFLHHHEIYIDPVLTNAVRSRFTCSLIGVLLPFVLNLSQVPEANAQPFIFSSVSTDIEALSRGSVALADLNGDGLLDVLFTGSSSSAIPFRPVSAVAMNRSTGDPTEDLIAFDIETLPTETFLGNASWSDYDLDGDLDFLLTGATSADEPFASVSLLFNNSDGRFSAVDAGFPGLHSSTVRWADIDNDGDEDVFLSGLGADEKPFAAIFRNNRSAGFSMIEAPTFQATFGDAAWGDYDSDGDLDLVVSGMRENGNFSTTLYQNDGSGGLTDSGTVLEGFAFASLEWADYDSDGDLDLISSGTELTVADILHGRTILYRNDGGLLNPVDDEFGGVFYGDLTWGDYDLDGDLDLFVMGRASLDGRHIGKIYRNDNDHFVVATGLVGTSTANAEWIDIDGDNDLDIFVIGQNLSGVPFSRLYRNDSRLVNRPPAPPSGLSSSVENDNVLLSWESGDDLETTVSALSYSVRVGTSPGAQDIFSARADADTGRRWLFRNGNVGQSLEWTLHDLPIGLYYWSVQTIDNSYIGSVFSEEGQFTISTGGKVSTSTEDDSIVPTVIALYPAYPNPTFSEATINYEIPTASSVEITVFDIIGRRVRSLVRAYKAGGTYSVRWNGESDAGSPVGSGVYFVRMRAGEHVSSQKLTLIK